MRTKTRHWIAILLALSLACAASFSFAVTVTYGYDAAGRLVKAEYADAAITYTYDAAGNVLAVAVGTPSGGTQFSRDYVQKAYVAYYGRPADPGGQGYWAAQMDAAGQSLDAIIGAFGNSDEFNRRYGGLSFTDLVTKIYQQTLGRNPDPAGLAFYVGELLAGRRTLQSITLDVLNGATTPPDSTVVANKLVVAAYYTMKVAAGCPYGTEQERRGQSHRRDGRSRDGNGSQGGDRRPVRAVGSRHLPRRPFFADLVRHPRVGPPGNWQGRSRAAGRRAHWY